MLANVILAYHVPYIMFFLLCFVVLPVEYFVFWLFQKGQSFHSLKIFGQMILANITSLIVGFMISVFIPTYGTMWKGGMSQDNIIGIFIGYIIAFFISWFIEYHIMHLLNKKSPFPKLDKTIGYANMASYFILYMITFAAVLF